MDLKIESVIPCLTRNPDAVPAKAGNYKGNWIPVFTGMTEEKSERTIKDSTLDFYVKKVFSNEAV